MATRYAVASGNWDDTTSVWSDTDGGSPGSYVPVDGDTFVISANVSVRVNVDQSAWTGLAGDCIIRGHATTPGRLYFANGTNGFLRFRTGATLAGTNLAAKGQLVATSDGAFSTTTPLTFANKAIIQLDGTAQINADYLDINMRPTEPTIAFARTYGRLIVIDSVDAETNILTAASSPAHGLSAGNPVRIRSSGSLPGGLEADYTYYVRTVSGNTFKLAKQNSDATIVDITSTGSGAIDVYTGHPASPATGAMNVLDDKTGDAAWSTDADHNFVVLSDDGAPSDYDQQRTTLGTKAAGVLTLAANVDSDQYPGARIWLVSRNVSIRSTSSTYAQPIINGGTSGVFGELRNSYGTGTNFYGYGIRYGTGHTVSTISGCSYGISYGTGHTVSTISGCYSGVYAGTGHTVSTISGCSTGVNGGTGHTVSTISGCSYGVGSGGIVGKCTFSNNTTDITIPSYVRLHDSTFSTVTGYLNKNPLSALYSYDHAGSVGRIRAYCGGGNIASIEWASVAGAIQSGCPVTPTHLHCATFEMASWFTHFEWPVSAGNGDAITVTVYARKQQAGETDLPRFALCEAGSAVGDETAELDAEDMADNTNWQTITLTYDPSDNRQIVLRFTAKNASGTCHFVESVAAATGGGLPRNRGILSGGSL